MNKKVHKNVMSDDLLVKKTTVPIYFRFDLEKNLKI